MKVGLKKKIFGDMVINIIATIIPVLVLQLWIMPQLSVSLGDEKYGLIVTIVALFNVVPAMLGNMLNNVRLLHNEVDDGGENPGDFNFILIFLAIINLIVITVFSFYYEKNISAISLILNIVVSVLWLFREYLIVAFRIKINFVAILISNIILGIGYAFGFLLTKVGGAWQLVFVCGYFISLIYIMLKCTLWREKPQRTNLFKIVLNESILLTLASLFGRVVTYADKLLLYPMMGGTMVAIYYAATLFGKIVSMGITPVSSVILSYLSKSKTKNDKTFNSAFFVTLCVCVIGYFICIAISKPVLNWLYPQYVDEAMKYIWVTTASAIISALISVVNPFVLKFFHMKWQMWTNLLNAILYVVLCLLFLYWFGLMGFCIGALLASVIKLAFLLFIYYRTKEKTAVS